MKAWILGSLLLSSASVIYCQTTAYQDASGNSSIYLANAKANITYNVSDSKFTIGYLFEPSADRAEDVRRSTNQGQGQAHHASGSGERRRAEEGRLRCAHGV